jgi:hypothetical protein
MNKRAFEFVSRPHAPLETHGEEQAINSRAMLQELYVLLEDYAPVWYTQEHHDRAIRVLLQRDS